MSKGSVHISISMCEELGNSGSSLSMVAGLVATASSLSIFEELGDTA